MKKYLVKECRHLNSSELEMINSFEDGYNGAGVFNLVDGRKFMIPFLGAPYPMNLSECRIPY